MAAFRCVGCLYFHIPEGICFAGFTCMWFRFARFHLWGGINMGYYYLCYFCTVIVCVFFCLLVFFCSVFLVNFAVSCVSVFVCLPFLVVCLFCAAICCLFRVVFRILGCWALWHCRSCVSCFCTICVCGIFLVCSCVFLFCAFLWYAWCLLLVSIYVLCTDISLSATKTPILLTTRTRTTPWLYQVVGFLSNATLFQ
jgi:hypothetical protein